MDICRHENSFDLLEPYALHDVATTVSYLSTYLKPISSFKHTFANRRAIDKFSHMPQLFVTSSCLVSAYGEYECLLTCVCLIDLIFLLSLLCSYR